MSAKCRKFDEGLRTFMNLVILLILPALLLLKIIQVFQESHFPNGPGASPEGPKNFVELLGYGVLRRVKDQSFWLIIAMIWAFRRIDTSWRLSGAGTIGRSELFRRILIWILTVCFSVVTICGYVAAMKSVGETFYYHDHPGFIVWIQRIEGTAICFVISSAAYYMSMGLVVAFFIGRRLKSAHDDSERTAVEEAASTLLPVGLIFAVAATFITLVSKWMHDAIPGGRMSGTDPIWRIVGEVAVCSIPFVCLSLLCYVMWCGRARVEIEFGELPLKMRCRVTSHKSINETHKY